MNIKMKLISLARRNPLLKLGYKKCGKKSVIYKPLIVLNKKYLSLGDRVTIREGARIELLSEWYEHKFSPQIMIGSDTSFEQNCHIISAGTIKIGENCVFSARVFITNVDHDYSRINTNILKQNLIVKDVTIGNNCFFGMDSKVFSGVTIGDNVIVGANALVTKDIPPYSVVVGSPAKIIKKYDFNLNRWVPYNE